MMPHGFAAHAIPSSTTPGRAELSEEPTRSIARPYSLVQAVVRPSVYHLTRMATDRSFRVLVFTAPVGEGHLAAARTIAECIKRANPHAEVVSCDVLEEFNPPLRWLLRDAYRWQLSSAPWLFGLVFAGLCRSRALRLVSRTLVSVLGSHSIRRVVRRDRPDVIVSTFPATTSILGCLRLRGKVGVPVVATITDFAGLEMWVDRGVDTHLVMHESLLLTARGCGRPHPFDRRRHLPRSSCTRVPDHCLWSAARTRAATRTGDGITRTRCQRALARGPSKRSRGTPRKGLPVFASRTRRRPRRACRTQSGWSSGSLTRHPAPRAYSHRSNGHACDLLERLDVPHGCGGLSDP